MQFYPCPEHDELEGDMRGRLLIAVEVEGLLWVESAPVMQQVKHERSLTLARWGRDHAQAGSGEAEDTV